MTIDDPILRLYKMAAAATIIGLVVISVFVGYVTILPFYANLKTQSEQGFERFGLSLQKQVEQQIGGFADIAI